MIFKCSKNSIAVTPTPSRFGVWEQIQQVNAAMAKFSQEYDGVYYIDTVSGYLNADGRPIESYFTSDRVHQNRSGYKLWSQKIKAALAPVLSPGS